VNKSVRRLYPFSTGAYIHTEMIPASLDPFRRKRLNVKKRHFQAQLASKNFTGDVLSAVVS